jgi:hypothetical protein
MQHIGSLQHCRRKRQLELENYSLLGNNRILPRNLDVMARALTVIYVPYNMHCSAEFQVWVTSDKLKWDKAN